MSESPTGFKATKEDLKDLELIKKTNRLSSRSAAIRHAIKVDADLIREKKSV